MDPEINNSVNINSQQENQTQNQSAQTNNITYAGFWVRFLAFLIDEAFVIIFMFIIFYIFSLENLETGTNWLGAVFYIIYSTLFLSIWSATPGKRIFNLVVLTENDNSSLTFTRSLKRSIIQIFSMYAFGIGYWFMGKDEKKRSLHDKKAGTVVLQKSKPTVLKYVIVFASLIFIVGFLLVFL